MTIDSTVLLFMVSWIIIVDSEVPPWASFIEPCSYVDAIPTGIFDPNYELRPQITVSYRRSIVCENIDNPLFDFRSMFRHLRSHLEEQANMSIASDIQVHHLHFDAFLLHHSHIYHLPKNLFQGLTFTGIVLHDNPHLNSIDLEVFTDTENDLEVFQTWNTNFTDDSKIFNVLQRLPNLRMVSMHNDRLHSIPNRAFNHTKLTDVWLGLEMGQTSQPIYHIGQYPLYRTPQLRTFRLFSPYLDRIEKYAFAQNHRSPMGTNDLQRMLNIYIGSPMLKSTSFEATSLTRFRSRAVFLRFFNTSITYLDESIFQPFLEMNPVSLLDVKYSPISETCDCRSAWINQDYCQGWDDSRVYGTSCCTLDLHTNCTFS